ncbi:ferric reductase-like transmembrane domain-containing protein [Streptomyces sp. RB6PN25]|uniref:Ferric reductase-like transmembrane domain-containing protein n=1 Tax=Streptomyces humicola TaxID=2953240 RepID=A0ABT1PP02_9ACTN|nr:ferric reductase-like transmembrane domain-containing protein [Streptomyces humicola]MCQ4079393.1 ferric reductase-like transmembrane domain-containing protein [Streptomyces humicola]
MDSSNGGRTSAWRSAAIVGLLGILTTAPFYVWIYRLQSRDSSAAAIGMPSMHMNQMGVFWAFPVLQATGLAALVWAYAGVALGLTRSGRRMRWLPLSRRQTDRLHRQISVLVIALILVHALATAFDAMGDSLVSVFVPWQASWQAAVLAYNLGIFAFYLAVLLGPTYYLRDTIGVRTWRLAHRFALVVYVLSVWHTLIIGADIKYYNWVRPLLWVAQIPLLVLFIRRLLHPAARSRNGVWSGAVRYGLACASAAAAVGIVVILANGSYASVVHSIQ